jgi:hypothetical protein
MTRYRRHSYDLLALPDKLRTTSLNVTNSSNPMNGTQIKYRYKSNNNATNLQQYLEIQNNFSRLTISRKVSVIKLIKKLHITFALIAIDVNNRAAFGQSRNLPSNFE